MQLTLRILGWVLELVAEPDTAVVEVGISDVGSTSFGFALPEEPVEEEDDRV